MPVVLAVGFPAALIGLGLQVITIAGRFYLAPSGVRGEKSGWSLGDFLEGTSERRDGYYYA